MDAALESAAELLRDCENSVAILFTDGHPSAPFAAEAAAQTLKVAGVRLLCVGIREDGVKP